MYLNTVKIHPKHSRAYLNLGVLYGDLNDREKEINSY
jgi:hypothetical protein